MVSIIQKFFPKGIYCYQHHNIDIYLQGRCSRCKSTKMLTKSQVADREKSRVRGGLE